jgi:hypothetical protein
MKQRKDLGFTLVMSAKSLGQLLTTIFTIASGVALFPNSTLTLVEIPFICAADKVANCAAISVIQ